MKRRSPSAAQSGVVLVPSQAPPLTRLASPRAPPPPAGVPRWLPAQPGQPALGPRASWSPRRRVPRAERQDPRPVPALSPGASPPVPGGAVGHPQL